MTYHLSNSLHEYLKPTTYPTRLHHLIIPPTRTLAYQQSYFPRTVKQWNNLPNYIFNIETIEQFDDRILGLDLLQLTSFFFEGPPSWM